LSSRSEEILPFVTIRRNKNPLQQQSILGSAFQLNFFRKAMTVLQRRLRNAK